MDLSWIEREERRGPPLVVFEFELGILCDPEGFYIVSWVPDQ